MPCPHGIRRLVIALAGLGFAGCYSPYQCAPYSPYGPGVPTYNQQPIPYQPQLTPAYPPTGTPTPVYPEAYPNGGFPPSTSPGSPSFGPTPVDGGTGTFPPSNGGSFSSPPDGGFDPSLPPPTGGTGSGLVPRYGDPGNLSPPAGNGNTFEGNTTPFSSDGAQFKSEEPFPGNAQFEPVPPSDTQLAGPELPSETWPVNVVSSERQVNAARPALSDSAPQPNPYAYDAQGYRWLRGIIDFDEQKKQWVLIYGPIPNPRDPYKGQLTLIDDGQFGTLQSNDVVLVEGYVDPTSPDLGTGQPQYRVERLFGPLVPKS